MVDMRDEQGRRPLCLRGQAPPLAEAHVDPPGRAASAGPHRRALLPPHDADHVVLLVEAIRVVIL